MFGIVVKFVMAQKLWGAFKGDDTVGKPLDEGLKRMMLYYKGLVKKHTPVDVGRLRGSITHRFAPGIGRVGTNVDYAHFVEYGTVNMEARHVMPGSQKRVFGVGPFSFAYELLKSWLDKGEHKVQKDIEKRFEV